MANKRYTFWIDEELLEIFRNTYPRGHTKVARMLVTRHLEKINARAKEIANDRPVELTAAELNTFAAGNG